MSKKKAKVEKPKYVYYGHRTQKPLFVSDKFVYEMLVYYTEPRLFSLYEEKETKTAEFKGYGSTKVLDKNKKKFVQYIELVGAPISFLEEHNYYKL